MNRWERMRLTTKQKSSFSWEVWIFKFAVADHENTMDIAQQIKIIFEFAQL